MSGGTGVGRPVTVSSATNVTYAVLVCVRRPVNRSSDWTSTRISMLLRSTDVIRASSSASWPIRIGARKDISSMAAVTTGHRQCRFATTAAARSIQCITVPPSTVPWTFAC